MNPPHKNTVLTVAQYFIQNKSTVRDTGKHFSLGKSTVHNYLTKYLPTLNPELNKKASALLQLNFNEKHIRGGLSTKQKFSSLSTS